jgi:hypothetical protein
MTFRQRLGLFFMIMAIWGLSNAPAECDRFDAVLLAGFVVVLLVGMLMFTLEDSRE